MLTPGDALFDDFRGFISKLDIEAHQLPLLQDYLAEWLEKGDAVVVAGGDFAAYLQGLIYIIAKWLDDPAIIDYEEGFGGRSYSRRAAGLLDLEQGGSICFDRDYFQRLAFERLLHR